MHKIIVIGGGASGMIAALIAAQNNNKVVLIEKNEKLGKKIYITGKGRCNLTNNVSSVEFLQNVVSNSKFMFSSINSFSPSDTISFFTDRGLRLKTERGNRVFPESDKASDVTKTLEKHLIKCGVKIELNTEVKDIVVKDGKVFGVKLENSILECDKIIICTGGVSYPTTGSTGDGYKFAKSVGHTITQLKPSLVGIELCGNDFLEMQGLSLKNVKFSIKNGDKDVYTDFGEALFTHFGVSGPIVLSASAVINKLDFSNLTVCFDLKPALDIQTLDKRMLDEININKNKEITSVIRSLVPKSMIYPILRQAGVKKDKSCSEITVIERQNLIKTLKNFKFKIKRLRAIEEAIVTSGGVNVKEINPKTMESKLINGLFFAGEVIDVDAFTGGFNLQIAFSTGYVAGSNV